MIAALLLLSASAKAPLLRLRQGDSWTYSGTVQWTERDSNQVRSAPVEWKTWVERSSTSGSTTVAVVRGFPFELAWYEPGQAPGYSVVTEDASGIYIERAADEAEAGQAMKRALRGEHPGSRIVRYPLWDGDCLAEEDDARPDRRYCWTIERVGNGTWELSYRSLPDHQTLRLAAGIGVTAYTFQHHGTVASADVKLVSFTRRNPRPPPPR